MYGFCKMRHCFVFYNMLLLVLDRDTFSYRYILYFVRRGTARATHEHARTSCLLLETKTILGTELVSYFTA